MKILHTSDRHLGRDLYGRQRYEEIDRFLAWVTQTIQQQSIEALLIAGDIFHTTTPTHRAQNQYYKFLASLLDTPCKHVVITGGNHDSPSLLDAPKIILSALNVYVVGGAPSNPQELLIPLKNKQGQVEAIVCAVPYLRESDLQIDHTLTDFHVRQLAVAQALKNYYATVVEHAKNLRSTQYPNSVLIGMAHLTVAGGETLEDDGVREVYIGGLNITGTDLFPEELGYVALGHLHVPQIVDKKEHIRYSGSPLAMGFGEANQKKQVCLVQTENGKISSIEAYPIPTFQTLCRVAGSTEEIAQSIEVLKVRAQSREFEGSEIWCELHLKTTEFLPDFEKTLQELIQGLPIEILYLRQTRDKVTRLEAKSATETLTDLTPTEVFGRLLAETQALNPETYTETDLTQVKQAFQTLLEKIHTQETNAL